MNTINDNIIHYLHNGFKLKEGKNPTNCALIFAYNGTGKTRLSRDFALNKRKKHPHTLYYNAYTEDLFTWHNGDDNDPETYLKIDTSPNLIQGLKGFDIITPLANYLSIYTDIEPTLKYDNPDDPEMFTGVRFTRTIYTPIIDPDTGQKDIDPETGKELLQPHQSGDIKISRGEERLFVWCFFRCILDQVLGGNPAYRSIRYIYIDDPMSSLDDNNVIAFATQLYDVIRQEQEKVMNEFRKQPYTSGEGNHIKFIISTHHALFFHTMSHGLSQDKSLKKYYLNRDRQTNELVLKNLDDSTPFYYNIAMMYEIQQAIYVKDKLYTYHFTILRGILERIRDFFGYPNFKPIFDGMEYREVKLTGERLTDFVSRTLNVLTHQASMFQPTLLNDDNKKLIKAVYDWLMFKYKFGIPDLADYRSEKTIKAAKTDESN